MGNRHKLAKRHYSYVLRKGRMQFYYITKKYYIAALIRSATNNQSWSLKIIALSLCGASQWRQSKQQHHCPVPPQPGPLWPRSGVEPEPCVCTGGRRGCWRLGPTGCPAETLQCHIPFPSPFCWRFATPGQTMSRRDAPWRGSERGEMTCCLPWNRPPPPLSASLPTVWDGAATHWAKPRQTKFKYTDQVNRYGASRQLLDEILFWSQEDVPW